MSMIERVARALYNEGRGYPVEFETVSWETQRRFRKMARAAITAMREPMVRMENAAFEADLDIYFGYYIDGRPGSPADVWRAMIDEALKDGREHRHRMGGCEIAR